MVCEPLARYEGGECVKKSLTAVLIVVIAVLAVYIVFLRGCAPITWAKSYGGTGEDRACSIQQTSDGGYIVAGKTQSFGARSEDFWGLKQNSNGSVAWQKRYGGAGGESAHSIEQTADGGYVVSGHTDSFGAGDSDFWVLKLKGDGTISWQKAYGGAGEDWPSSIQQTSDGGYIVAGATQSFGAGWWDSWILKLNSDGTVCWQKRYGGTYGDSASSIQQTGDGGYIVAGFTESFGAGSWCDFWVLKLNGDGTVAWQKRYGGADDDQAYSIQQTSDGGYIVAGCTSSFDADWWGDFWVLNLNSDGTILWQKRYGGAQGDSASSILQTRDGGYIVAGTTQSFGARSEDFWVLKLNSNGSVAWQKRYSGAGGESAHSIEQTADGGYVVSGHTYSFGAGDSDFWVLKLASDGTIAFNPTTGAQMVDTNAVPADTSCTVTDTTVSAVDTSCTVTNTNAVPVDTNATAQQQAP
jgi:uncharacterized delta-60 repeat protein